MDEQERRDRRWAKLQGRPRGAGRPSLGALGSALNPAGDFLQKQTLLDGILVADDTVAAGAPPRRVDLDSGVIAITSRPGPQAPERSPDPAGAAGSGPVSPQTTPQEHADADAVGDSPRSL